MPEPDLSAFRALPLPGGFVLDSIKAVPGPLIDPIGRAALAKTTIQGTRITIVFDREQSVDEQSISIYHEVIEGLTVGLPAPPLSVTDFCEGDFEREARAAFQRFGVATPATVLAFLATFDFR
jgi:hypothetical protein